MRVCVDKPLAAHAHGHAHTGKWRDHRSQAANTQATTNNHHTNTHQTSLMVVTHTGWSLTHTRGKQDKGHSKTKAVVAMACTVTMPWHKRATPVVMPPWLVHQVHAPPMQVATSTHTHSATHTHTRGREKRSWERGHKEWRGTVA